MRITRKLSTFGNSHQEFFENGLTSPLGQFLSAGTGQHGTAEHWGQLHQAKTHARYSLVMLLPDSNGYYHNENGFQCPLKYGDFILNFPHLKCVSEPGKDELWNEMCLSFKGVSFDALRAESILDERQPVWHLRNPAFWIKRFRGILEAPRPTSGRGAARETAQFLAFLLEMLEAATPKNMQSADNDWFTQACAMLVNDMSRKVATVQIAESLGMNYHTFRALFKERCGESPMRYRDQTRKRIACERLEETCESCWVIARHLGFYDEHHFSNTFKKWTGETPNQYRVKHRSEQP